MKKTLKAVIASAVAILTIAVPAFAFAPVGDINVPYGTPTVDGTLAQGEWSEANKITVDQSNATADGWSGEVPADLKIEYYYTWDNDNFYAAGHITDPSVNFSAGSGDYGGDAFQLSLNVGNVFKTDEYPRAIFYSFGCQEDGGLDVMVQESSVNDGAIEDAGFSKKTDTGWDFEFKLPWATLVQHVKDKANVDVTVAAGLKINALICYLDHDDTGALANAFFTSNTEPGGWDPDVFGIYLTLIDKPADTEAPAADTDAPADTAVDAPETETPAAQTLDTVVVAAAVLALGAAAVVIASKKR